ncbi:MAG: hypothetical protein LBJ72_11665 [Dysgonamonadaceae bacterium]|jgi:hypothetical protein|nr:hypothetical protein [Dysgonamonadaceae bacterium]
MFGLHQEIVRVIKEKTPDGMNPVDVLYEIIPIRKESLYRRLRGEMPFTLDEASRIAVHLGISLDKLLPHKSKDACNVKFVHDDLKNGDCKTINQIREALITVKKNSEASLYTATNGLPFSHLYKYPTLSKFRIFAQNYQHRKETLPQKMSELVISPQIRESEISYHTMIQQIPINYIWAKNMVQPFVTDIRYFSEINLLSQEEIDKLKEEAYSLLNDLEQDVSAGKMLSGAPFTVFLSNNFFDNNCIYVESHSFRSCFFKIFGIDLLSSTESDLCDKTKEWIWSLMKYSVLISKSGIVERVHFFKQQRNLLDSI